MLNWLELLKDCAKGLLISLNVLFIFIALCLFGFATVDLTILAQYGEEVGGSATGDIVIIVASLLLVLLAVFGCYGTAREKEKILYTYIMFLMAYLVMEVIIAIFVSIQRYGLHFRVTEWLREDFYSNVTGDATASLEHDQLWDELQTYYQCCGLNGPEDYAALMRPISLSCCEKAQLARNDLAKENMYRACIKSKSYYNAGCEDEILWFLKNTADLIFGLSVISFWLEAAAMLLSITVVKQIRDSVQVYKHTVKY